MNDNADKGHDTATSDTKAQAGLAQNATKHSNGPPKEGSNRGFETDEHARANIEDSISSRPPKKHFDHADDGHSNETKVDDEEVSDPAQPT